MAQLPGSAGDWQPLGSQFLDVGASTALTIPALPAAGGSSRSGVNYVAVIQAQGGTGQWIREDGNAVTAAYTGGRFLNPGDFLIVYGLAALKAIRVISNAQGTGSLAVTYYLFR